MASTFGSIMNTNGMKAMNEKTWNKFMAGIKHHVETGENVDPKTKLDTSQVLAVGLQGG